MTGISTTIEQETPDEALAETVPGFRLSAPIPDRALKKNRPSVGDPLIGTMIGDFRVDDVIASGGMGTVYKATQLQPIRRVVALKTIRSGAVHETTLLRFQRERQALAQLSHPDIAQIFEADNTRDGQPYFVMEYVDGQPIDEYCDDRKLSVRDRLHLTLRVVKAVSEAHRVGIIHRDLKPSNILIADDDEGPVVRLIDFGIAKFTEETAPEANDNATQCGEFIGTPTYMSPEQALSSSVDARTDVFAIGALLFKLLTGTTPLQPTESRLARIIEEIRAFEPETPSHRVTSMARERRLAQAKSLGFESTRKLINVLRRELDWITLKSLASNRTDRYATAEDFAADLTAFLEYRPVSAVAPGFSYRLKKLYQRRKPTVIATLVSAVAALFAVGSVSVSWWEIQQERQAELRILETEFHVLLRLAAHARQRAIAGGATSRADFADAREALNDARNLIHSEPALSGYKSQLDHAFCVLSEHQSNN